MKILKLISKIGLLSSLGAILVVGIIDFSSRSPREQGMEKLYIDTMSTSDVVFTVSLIVFIISLFFRILVHDKEWKGLVGFTKYFFPIAIVFYLLAIKFGGSNSGIFDSPRYWMGISLASIYTIALMYFALKTFYQRW